MIIVDDQVSKVLKEALKDFLRHPSEVAEISLAFPQEKISRERLRTEIPLLVQREIPDKEAKLFFCEDGTVIILAANVYTRDAHRLASAIANRLDLSALECRLEYHTLQDYAGKQLMELERRDFEEERRKHGIESQQQVLNERLQAMQKRNHILNGVFNPGAAATLADRRQHRKTPEIMVIEDDAFSRRLVANILAKDYRLTSLGEVEMALATYVSIAPDILFLDINLPMVTGHELLEKIIRVDPDAYVIMLSGNADQKNIMEAMKRGAKGFVAKPFTPDKLHQYIQRCPTMH